MAGDSGMTDTLHPSHVTRGSDASSFDEICINCGATDLTCGGWGKLAEPCPKPTGDSGMTEQSEALEAIEKAMDMISALCLPKGSVGSRAWIMSIPARPDYDPDLVIADALRKAREVIQKTTWQLAEEKPEKDQQDELYNKDHELYNKKLEYREIAWADMKPDLYAGENCDEALPQWEAYFEGDMGSETGLKEIDFAASNFPSGTRIMVSVPLCPKCSTDEEAHDSEICDFDWALWRDHNYS